MSILSDLKQLPIVQRHEAILEIATAIKQLFNPIARKYVFTFNREYIQITVFAKPRALSYMGEETKILELDASSLDQEIQL